MIQFTHSGTNERKQGGEITAFNLFGVKGNEFCAVKFVVKQFLYGARGIPGLTFHAPDLDEGVLNNKIGKPFPMPRQMRVNLVWDVMRRKPFINKIFELRIGNMPIRTSMRFCPIARKDYLDPCSSEATDNRASKDMVFASKLATVSTRLIFLYKLTGRYIGPFWLRPTALVQTSTTMRTTRVLLVLGFKQGWVLLKRFAAMSTNQINLTVARAVIAAELSRLTLNISLLRYIVLANLGTLAATAMAEAIRDINW